jgi:hypothetical protein
LNVVENFLLNPKFMGCAMLKFQSSRVVQYRGRHYTPVPPHPEVNFNLSCKICVTSDQPQAGFLLQGAKILPWEVDYSINLRLRMGLNPNYNILSGRI